jgi:hypothetical protein
LGTLFQQGIYRDYTRAIIPLVPTPLEFHPARQA